VLETLQKNRIISSPTFTIFIIGIIVYSLFLIHDFDNFGPKRFVTGDEPHYFVQTESLVLNKSFNMEKIYGSGSNPEFDIGISYHTSFRNGHFTANHGWGIPFLTALPYLGFNFTGILFTIVVFSALVNVLIYKITSLFTKKQIAFYTALIFAFGTLIFPYSKLLYPDFLEGLMVLFPLYIIFKKEYNIVRLASAGSAIAFGTFLKVDFVILGSILVVLMILMLIKTKKKKLIFAFLIPIVIGGSLFLIYNELINGDFFSFGLNPIPGYTDNPFGNFGIMFFDRYNGLIIFSPVVFFSILGLPSFFRRDRVSAAAVTSLVVIWIVSHGFINAGYGWGEDYPIRYFMTILPLAAIPLAIAIENFHQRKIFLIFLIIFIAIGIRLGSAIEFSRWTGLTSANNFSKSELLSQTYFGLEKIFPALYGQELFSYYWHEATAYNILFIIIIIILATLVLIKPIVSYLRQKII